MAFRAMLPATGRNQMTAESQMKAKADAFYALHHGPKAFIIPNPWDAGSARLLAHLGFKALATTSMGYAFSIGQRDGTLTRDRPSPMPPIWPRPPTCR